VPVQVDGGAGTCAASFALRRLERGDRAAAENLAAAALSR
jgi:hypothetical protein